MNGIQICKSASELVIEQRVCKGSRGGYKSKLNSIKGYFLENQLLEYLDGDNNIIVPLPQSVLENLFGWIATNTDLPKKNRKVKKSQF